MAAPRRDPANDNSLFDVYSVELQASDTIKVMLESDAFDAYLHLLDPSGERVVDADDIAEQANTDAYFEYTVTTAGMHEVLANAYMEGETGPYTLTLQVVPGDKDLARKKLSF